MKRILRERLRALGFDVVRYQPPADRLEPDARFGLDVFGMVVARYLSTHPAGAVTLMQIGANDGIKEDAVHPVLASTGMRGILVEPLPQPYAKLVANYAGCPAVTTVNCAVGERDGELTLYSLRPGLVEESSLIASFDPANVRKWQAIWNLPEDAVVSTTVACVTIDTLMRERTVARIDIAAVDTEGMDHIVCNQLLNLANPPDILHFEYVNCPKFEIRKLLERLHDQHYAIARSGLDITAVRGAGVVG